MPKSSSCLSAIHKTSALPQTLLFLSAFFLISLFLAQSLIFADEAPLNTVRLEVEKRSESLHLQQNDPLKILPRLAQAAEEEKKGHADLARELLISCTFDLDLLESQHALDTPENTRKQARLEMLFDLLRGYALTSILALLIIKLPWFRRRRKTQPRLTEWGTAFLLLASALVFGLSDIFRFGEAGWSYFDLQVVLTACAGLASGLFPGLLVGTLLSAGRFFLQPNIGTAVAPLISAGIIGGLLFYSSRYFKKILIFSILVGLFAGLAHSFFVYFPSRNSFPFSYLFSSALFITLSEAFGVFLFFVVTHGLLREEAQETTRHELIRSQLLFLQAQIKPHFLFNALNTIAAVCSAENAQKSRALIGHLADFFRHALETKDPVLSLEKEFEFVDAYLELEKARFGDEVEIVREIHLSREALDTLIPILIIQPVVENAIRHGLRKKTAKGTVTIAAKEVNSLIEIQITDNGAGTSSDFFENYLKKNIGKAEGHGIGVRNIDERLRRFFGKGEWLRFETTLGKGTCVTLKIPKPSKLKI